MEKQRRQVALWLLCGCALIFAMVVIGGITRLTKSGLSMVEWSVTGSFPPTGESDWRLLFDHYKTSPEFRQVNNHFTLSDFKRIFWWEFIHRMTGRLIGFVFLIPFFWFLVRKKFPPGFLRRAVLLFAAGLGQGLLGWAMVKSGLNKEPHVSHYLLAAHLIAAFTTFAITFWFALDLLTGNRAVFPDIKLKRISVLLIVLTGLQIVYGAFVAGLHAGYYYPTYPMMGESWIPPEMTNCSSFTEMILSNPPGVQFVHRTLALLIAGIYILAFIRSRKLPAGTRVRSIISVTGLVLLLQLGLGISTILLHMPLALASAHQAGAFALLSCLLAFRHALSAQPSMAIA